MRSSNSCGICACKELSPVHRRFVNRLKLLQTGQIEQATLFKWDWTEWVSWAPKSPLIWLLFSIKPLYPFSKPASSAPNALYSKIRYCRDLPWLYVCEYNDPASFFPFKTGKNFYTVTQSYSETIRLEKSPLTGHFFQLTRKTMLYYSNAICGRENSLPK